MSYYEKDFRSRLSIDRENSALITLIAINLSVFVIFGFIRVFYIFSSLPAAEFYTNILNWFSLPASFDVFLTRPWTIITHFFLHDPNDIWSVFGNVLWLWAFG